MICIASQTSHCSLNSDVQNNPKFETFEKGKHYILYQRLPLTQLMILLFSLSIKGGRLLRKFKYSEKTSSLELLGKDSRWGDSSTWLPGEMTDGDGSSKFFNLALFANILASWYRFLLSMLKIILTLKVESNYLGNPN